MESFKTSLGFVNKIKEKIIDAGRKYISIKAISQR